MQTLRRFVESGMSQYRIGIRREIAEMPPRSRAHASPEVQRFVAAADPSVTVRFEAGARRLTVAQRVRLVQQFFEPGRPFTPTRVRRVLFMLADCKAARRWRAAHADERDPWLNELETRLLDLFDFETTLGLHASRVERVVAAFVHPQTMDDFVAALIDALVEADLIKSPDVRAAREALTALLKAQRGAMARTLALFLDQAPVTIGGQRAAFTLTPTPTRKTRT